MSNQWTKIFKSLKPGEKMMLQIKPTDLQSIRNISSRISYTDETRTWSVCLDREKEAVCITCKGK